MKTKKVLEPILLLDGAHGIYIPKMFHDEWNHLIFDQDQDKKQIETNVTPETWNDISNFDNDLYWESWEDIIENLKFHSSGETFVLYQDGDLWAIPENYDNKEFFNQL